MQYSLALLPAKGVCSYRITLNHVTSHHMIATCHIIPYHITSHPITSHHIPSHHIASHDITWHHITSHHITSHHITSHHITSYHIASCHTKWHRVLLIFRSIHLTRELRPWYYRSATSCLSSAPLDTRKRRTFLNLFTLAFRTRCVPFIANEWTLISTHSFLHR